MGSPSMSRIPGLEGAYPLRQIREQLSSSQPGYWRAKMYEYV